MYSLQETPDDCEELEKFGKVIQVKSVVVDNKLEHNDTAADEDGILPCTRGPISALWFKMSITS